MCASPPPLGIDGCRRPDQLQVDLADYGLPFIPPAHDYPKSTVARLQARETLTDNNVCVQIMALYDEPQWAVLGDTFAVGCEWGPSIVYRDTSFHDNPDGKHPIYRYTLRATRFQFPEWA